MMWNKVSDICIWMALIGLFWIGMLAFWLMVRDAWNESKNAVKWLIGKVKRNG